LGSAAFPVARSLTRTLVEILKKGEFSENFKVAKILAVRAGNARKWISSLKASLIQPKSELQPDRLVKICEKNENF